MGGSEPRLDGQGGSCGQSNSVGHSTLNEKATCESSGSKPFGCSEMVGEATSRNTYREKSASWLVRTTSTRLLSGSAPSSGSRATCSSTDTAEAPMSAAA